MRTQNGVTIKLTENQRRQLHRLTDRDQSEIRFEVIGTRSSRALAGRTVGKLVGSPTVNENPMPGIFPPD